MHPFSYMSGILLCGHITIYEFVLMLFPVFCIITWLHLILPSPPVPGTPLPSASSKVSVLHTEPAVLQTRQTLQSPFSLSGAFSPRRVTCLAPFWCGSQHNSSSLVRLFLSAHLGQLPCCRLPSASVSSEHFWIHLLMYLSPPLEPKLREGDPKT